MSKQTLALDIIDVLRSDPCDLDFNQAESALAILKLKQKGLMERLYKESGLLKYNKSRH